MCFGMRLTPAEFPFDVYTFGTTYLSLLQYALLVTPIMLVWSRCIPRSRRKNVADFCVQEWGSKCTLITLGA